MAKLRSGYVFKDRSGCWWARVTFTDAAGKRRNVKRCTYTDETGNKWRARNKTEAKDPMLKQLLSDLSESPETILEGGRTTLHDYLSRWLRDSVKSRVAPRTYADYTELLQRYITGMALDIDRADEQSSRNREGAAQDDESQSDSQPITEIGRKNLSDIRPLEIQALYSKMQERGLSARTVRYTHAVLSSALKQAVKWGLLPKNPAAFVDLPKSKQKEMKALSPEEAARFITAAAEDPQGLIFNLALSTGMRPEEYLALQWKDIDFERNVLAVRRTICWRRSGGGWYFGEPKTARSRRSIPLPGSIVTRLGEHKRKQEKAKRKSGTTRQDIDLLFTTSDGGPLLDRNLSRRNFKAILKRAGLPASLRLYDLRHSCATLLLTEGTNPKVVAERLGHASTTMTMDIYSHVLPSLQEEATKKLEDLLYS
ncbi:MAG: tyrosine-type recombinase/integrase, partial [Blastocatellia bacterium]